MTSHENEFAELNVRQKERIFFQDTEGRKLVVCRSYGKTPNGNPLGGRWSVFDIETGDLRDFDQYLNDIIERWDLEA